MSQARIDRFVPTLGSLSDSELVRRCLEDDQDAWEALIQRHQGLVYSTALEVGLSPDDAGDVFQDVWIELNRSLRRLRNPGALPRWLIVATRRLSWKVAIRNRRIIPQIPPDLVDPWALPDEAMEFVESRNRIDIALRELGDPCGRLLRLLFLESPRPTHRTIAQRTGLAMGSIGPTRNRCLDKLRRILGRRR
jgi:RNA polymerase sigma factor (sigma-70 family)